MKKQGVFIFWPNILETKRAVSVRQYFQTRFRIFWQKPASRAAKKLLTIEAEVPETLEEEEKEKEKGNCVLGEFYQQDVICDIYYIWLEV